MKIGFGENQFLEFKIQKLKKKIYIYRVIYCRKVKFENTCNIPNNVQRIFQIFFWNISKNISKILKNIS